MRFKNLAFRVPYVGIVFFMANSSFGSPLVCSDYDHRFSLKADVSGGRGCSANCNYSMSATLTDITKPSEPIFKDLRLDGRKVHEGDSYEFVDRLNQQEIRASIDLAPANSGSYASSIQIGWTDGYSLNCYWDDPNTVGGGMGSP